MLVTGLVRAHVTALHEGDLHAGVPRERLLARHFGVDVGGPIRGHDDDRVEVTLERLDPGGWCARARVPDDARPCPHAGTEVLRERRQLLGRLTDPGEAGMAHRDVDPGRRRGVPLGAGARDGLAERLVECRDLGRRSDVRPHLAEPAASGVGGGELEEDQCLVVLVEARQQVALDVVERELDVGHRGGVQLCGSGGGAAEHRSRRERRRGRAHAGQEASAAHAVRGTVRRGGEVVGGDVHYGLALLGVGPGVG